MDMSTLHHLFFSNKTLGGPLHWVQVWVIVHRVTVGRKLLPLMVCFETSMSFPTGHWAAGRWQCLLVTTNVGHFLTSNLEIKTSFSHDQVLEVVYMNRGKIYLLDHKAHAECSHVSIHSADGPSSLTIFLNWGSRLLWSSIVQTPKPLTLNCNTVFVLKEITISCLSFPRVCLLDTQEGQRQILLCKAATLCFFSVEQATI